MEKLLKIQSIIMMIEDLQGLKKEFRSKFIYENENHLEIKTYCTDTAIGYYKALDNGKGYSVYIHDTKIKILEYQTV